MTRTIITKEDFITLIKRFGSKDELYTFDLCSNHGIELDGSTIDKIAYNPLNGDILFYYNENTDDFDKFESFSLDNLRYFYNDILWSVWNEDGVTCKQKIGIFDYLTEKFKGFFSDEYERCEFLDGFLNKVVEDIEECADWSRFAPDEICIDDVDIAVARLLKTIVE